MTLRWWQTILAGAGLGLLWGATARGMMRLFSTDPEFSWSGTLIILGLASFQGLLLGVVEALRRRRFHAWRSLISVPGLLLFAGPGIPFLPAALIGGLGLSGRGPAWLRWALAVAGLGLSTASLFTLGMSERDATLLGLPRLLAGIALFLLLSCLLAAGWSVVFRRRWHGEAEDEDGETVAPQALSANSR